ncbi:MAG: hypothetical protein ACT4UP_08865 [Gammaproteobacteria bacterium]
MKNITVTLDEKTAIWVRVHAAKCGKSVSRLLGEILQQHMRDQREYLEAMRRFQAIKPRHFEWVDGRRPTREELYDRGRIR